MEYRLFKVVEFRIKNIQEIPNAWVICSIDDNQQYEGRGNSPVLCSDKEKCVQLPSTLLLPLPPVWTPNNSSSLKLEHPLSVSKTVLKRSHFPACYPGFVWRAGTAFTPGLVTWCLPTAVSTCCAGAMAVCTETTFYGSCHCSCLIGLGTWK